MSALIKSECHAHRISSGEFRCEFCAVTIDADDMPADGTCPAKFRGDAGLREFLQSRPDITQGDKRLAAHEERERQARKRARASLAGRPWPSKRGAD